MLRGSGRGLEEKEVIPRSSYLTEFLTTHGIKYETPVAGENSPSMMRGDHTYFMFFLPELHITILVNNQEGNATFLFFGVADNDVAMNLTTLKKEEYTDPRKNIHSFQPLEWTGTREEWETNLLELITRPAPASEEEDLDGEGVSIKRLATELGVAHETIVRRINKLFPEIDIERLNSRNRFGREIFVLTSEQASKIRDDLRDQITLKETLSVVPEGEGWITIINLKNELGVNKENIIRLIKELFPDLDRRKPNFLSARTKQPTFFLSEIQANQIREHLKEYTELKKRLPSYSPYLGERTVSSLAKELGVSANTIRSRINELFPHLDVTIPNSLDDSNIAVFRLVKEQADQLRSNLSSYVETKKQLTRPPKDMGWIVRSHLATELMIGEATLKKMIEETFPLLDTDPNFLDDVGKPAFFLSKEQADQLRKIEIKQSLPLKGKQLSLEELAGELGVVRATIVQRLRRYYPDVDPTQPNAQNDRHQPVFCLTKEQEELIRKKMSERLKPVPEGEEWVSLYSLANEFGEAISVVRKLVTHTYPELNPREPNIINNTGKPTFYITKDRSFVIREKIKEYKKQKQELAGRLEDKNKISIGSLARELGQNPSVVRTRIKNYLPEVDISQPNGLNDSNIPTFYLTQEQAEKIRGSFK